MIVVNYSVALLFFFFKQKTAYEMRISDWSSDVCSSDLQINATVVDLSNKNKLMEMVGDKFHVLPGVSEVPSDELIFASDDWIANQIGRASCRERVCQYV